MTEEKRFFIKSKGPLGPVFSIGFGYPDFEYSMFADRQKEVIYKHEIPRKFWGCSLDELENFFENVFDPKKMRIKKDA